MSLLDQIRQAQVRAGEDVVIRNLEQLGLLDRDRPSARAEGAPVPVVRIKQMHPDAIVPTRATPGAACVDLHAIEGGTVTSLHPCTFSTGLAVEIPPGWVMKIYSRSGHGFKRDTRLANCVGIIDSDYRGVIAVRLTCDHEDQHLEVWPGDRIAQAMLERVPEWKIEMVDALSETERGAGGFGSTGQGAL